MIVLNLQAPHTPLSLGWYHLGLRDNPQITWLLFLDLSAFNFTHLETLWGPSQLTSLVWSKDWALGPTVKTLLSLRKFQRFWSSTQDPGQRLDKVLIIWHYKTICAPWPRGIYFWFSRLFQHSEIIQWNPSYQQAKEEKLSIYSNWCRKNTWQNPTAITMVNFIYQHGRCF